MTREQYQNWRDFALRMARVCYRTSRRPAASWVVEQVDEFIGSYEIAYEPVCNWDESAGTSWSVSDEWASWEADETPLFNLECDYEDDDDEDLPDEEVLDERAEKARSQWQEQFLGPVVCCVRAGLDMATTITGGVVGFAVADLQAMFPEGVPCYVQRHYDAPLDRADPSEGLWL